MLATAADVPWIAPSATTEKVWMPPLAMARQKKNSRLRRIGALSSRSSPTLAALLAVAFGAAGALRAARGSTLPATISSSADGERQHGGEQEGAVPAPQRRPQASTMAGVTPKPR